MVYSLAKPEPWNFHRAGVAPEARRLWDGLICLVSAHEGGGQPWETINSRPGVITGTQSWAVGPRGMSLYSGDVATLSGGWNLGIGLAVPAEAVTIVIHKRKMDGTNRSSGGFGYVTNSDHLKCGSHIPWNNGEVMWDFGNSGDARLSVSGLTFGDDVWCFNVGKRGMEIWQNGYLRASKPENPTRTTTADPFLLGNGNTGTSNQYPADNAQYAFFAMWNYQLSSSDCAALSLDPWPLIRWAPPRLKAGTAPAGGGGSGVGMLLLGVG